MSRRITALAHLKIDLRFNSEYIIQVEKIIVGADTEKEVTSSNVDAALTVVHTPRCLEPDSSFFFCKSLLFPRSKRTEKSGSKSTLNWLPFVASLLSIISKLRYIFRLPLPTLSVSLFPPFPSPFLFTPSPSALPLSLSPSLSSLCLVSLSLSPSLSLSVSLSLLSLCLRLSLSLSLSPSLCLSPSLLSLRLSPSLYLSPLSLSSVSLRLSRCLSPSLSLRLSSLPPRLYLSRLSLPVSISLVTIHQGIYFRKSPF
ncbi:unnamed protein product [Acanthosepion pharaonis]|uniref:Uncharacterized protein n=1 Tax=Acanthosepion pharaonis TaxID=158019 RepID=A0A812DH04_ACAPH|nr:unnamed protein product [Sepia pharaonis]